MSYREDLPKTIKEAAVLAVDAVKRHLKQVVRLVTKQPKKPALSWESIIGDAFPERSAKPVVARSQKVAGLAPVNQKLAQLPQVVFDELLVRIQKNYVDEIEAIRLYEKLFDCEIRILHGHIHTYRCMGNKSEETIDFATLTGRLIKLFIEHQAIVGRSASPSAVAG